jgi:hypothetical protein
MNFLETLWSIFVIFIFLSYLVVLFQIVTDLFRDHELSGWAKALWFLGLVFLPVLVGVAYLVARGRSMALRQMDRTQTSAAATEDYIRQVAGSKSRTERIADAKRLLDEGAITPAEFEQLKADALA